MTFVRISTRTTNATAVDTCLFLGRPRVRGSHLAINTYWQDSSSSSNQTSLLVIFTLTLLLLTLCVFIRLILRLLFRLFAPAPALAF